MSTQERSGLHQHFLIESVESLPETGSYMPGTAKVTLAGRIRTFGISSGVSEGRTAIEADISTIRPVEYADRIVEVEVHSWEERFKGAQFRFTVDLDTQCGCLYFS